MSTDKKSSLRANVQNIVRIDNYTRVCLTFIAVLLTVLIAGLWAQVPLAGDARAAEPFIDASAQRFAAVKAQEQTNQKLDELIALLRSGDVRVQTVEPKDKDDERAKNATKAK